jgi:hypothetical protein
MNSQALGALSNRLARANARDVQEQLAILEEIRVFRRKVEHGDRTDLVGYVDAASLLTEYLTRMGCIGPEGILRVVSKLIATVQESLELHSGSESGRPAAEPVAQPAAATGRGAPGRSPAPPPIAPRRPAPVPVGSEREIAAPKSRMSEAQIQELLSPDEAQRELRMVSDRVLGELLAELKVITRDQIEEALFVQRATGVRIGEALVEIGATSWKQIEEALKIQSSMRSRPDSRP